MALAKGKGQSNDLSFTRNNYNEKGGTLAMRNPLFYLVSVRAETIAKEEWA
jgi:hypothetical protein